MNPHRTEGRSRWSRRAHSARRLAIVAPILYATFVVSAGAQPQLPDTELPTLSGSLSIEGEHRSASDPFLDRGTDGRASIRGTYRTGFGEIPFHFSATSVAPGRLGEGYRFGVHPELFDRSLNLHGGSFSPDASDLTLGNASLLGVGAEFNAASLRAAVWYGNIEQSTPGAYASGSEQASNRTVVGGRFGFGRKESGRLDLSAVRVADQLESPEDISDGPEENSIASVDFRLPLADRDIILEGEAAISAWSSNRLGEALDDVSIPGGIFAPNETSQFDGAVSLSLCVRPVDNMSFQVSSDWIGPGYVALAQPYLRNDLFGVTGGASFSLFDGRLQTDGRIGVEWDNVRNTRENTTRQLNGSLSAIARPGDRLLISASLYDYGSNTEQSDTSLYGYVSQSFNLTPSYTWQSGSVGHTASVNATWQSGAQRNADSTLSASSVHGLNGSWDMFVTSGTSIGLSGGITDVSISGASSLQQSAGGSVATSWLNGDVRASVRAGVTHYNEPDALSIDLSGSVIALLDDLGQVSFSLANSNDRGFGSAGSTHRELYATIRYDIGF